jgi:hypothetical protein
MCHCGHAAGDEHSCSQRRIEISIFKPILGLKPSIHTCKTSSLQARRTGSVFALTRCTRCTCFSWPNNTSTRKARSAKDDGVLATASQALAQAQHIVPVQAEGWRLEAAAKCPLAQSSWNQPRLMMNKPALAKGIGTSKPHTPFLKVCGLRSCTTFLPSNWPWMLPSRSYD